MGNIAYVLNQLKNIESMLESTINHGYEINEINILFKHVESTHSILEQVVTKGVKNKFLDTLDELIQAANSVKTAKQSLEESKADEQTILKDIRLIESMINSLNNM